MFKGYYQTRDTSNLQEFVNVEKMNKENIERLFLEWFNNFLTVSYFAEYHGFTIEKSERIINIGRRLNHRR